MTDQPSQPSAPSTLAASGRMGAHSKLSQAAPIVVVSVAIASLVAIGGSGVAIAVIAALFAVALCFGRSASTSVAVLLVWIALQNLLAPLLLTTGALSSSDVRVLIGTKELMAFAVVGVLGVLLLVGRGLKLQVADRLWLAYAGVVLLFIINPFVPRPDFFYLAVSARALLVPAFFYILGRLVTLRDPERVLVSLVRVCLAIGVCGAVFGFIEMFLLGDSFWRNIGIERYWTEVKGLSSLMLVNGLPANFYGQYGLVTRLGTGVRRMASIYGDPLAAGYSLYFATLLSVAAAYVSRGRARGWYAAMAVFIGIAVVLTNTRAALVALLVSALLILFSGRREGMSRVAALLFMVAAIVFAATFRSGLVASVTSAFTLEDPSALAHLSAVAKGLPLLATPRALVGFGLGSAGAPAFASPTHTGIAESTFLVVYAEIGIVGIVAFVSALVVTYRYVRKHVQVERGVGIPALVATPAALVGYCFTGVMSEQLLTATSTAAFWIILGGCVSWSAEHEGRQ